MRNIIFLFALTVLVQGSTIIKDRRIVGGEPAPDGAMPYQVSVIALKVVFPERHYCSGSILNKRWVITAGQCGINLYPSRTIILVGTNKLDEGGTNYTVERVLTHPRYNYFKNKHDISLLKTRNEIEFNDRVQSIDLPTEDTSPGTQLMLSGWGTTDEPGASNDLQWVNTSSLSFEDCREKLMQFSNITEGHICAFSQEDVGACYGDAGAPLVDGKSLVGVASFMIGRCGGGYPDVFTRVFYYKQWIAEKIQL